MVKRVLLFSILVFVLTECVDYEIISQKSDQKINIDGENTEWQGKLVFFNEERFAIGFQHDDNNLYMCLSTNDRNKARQFLTRGMNIWFDTGTGKSYAIRFPLFDRTQMRGFFLPDKQESNEQRDIIREILNNQNQFMVLNEDDYPLGTFLINGNSGIQLKPAMTKDSFVFELQYALKPYNDNLVNVLQLTDDNQVTVRFESMEIDRPGRGGGFKGGPGAGGMNDGGTSMGGGRGMGRAPFSDGEPMEDIDFSIKVALSN